MAQPSDEQRALALEAADECERLGNVAKSMVGAVPEIVMSDRRITHQLLYEAEAERWHKLAAAVRACAS